MSNHPQDWRRCDDGAAACAGDDGRELKRLTAFWRNESESISAAAVAEKPLPLKGQAQPQGGHGAAIRTAPVGALPPRMGDIPQRRPGAASPGAMEFGVVKHD